METENKSIVKASEVKLPKFVEQAYDSIEGMKQFAGMLLESKLVPDSYYEKGADNKPDYTKGKVSAVVVVLLQAQQLAVPPMTALQHIVPVNGLLSIKGDLAKTMIFASGKLRKDSWKETVEGTIEQENMVVTITATRDDNGVTLTRSFSVDKAKRMGLWVTKQMAEGQDGWKHKKSAWYKTPDRMLQYRALGNLARDLFSDVLLNMYTTEEAVDIDRDTTEVVETESGAKITIPDKEHTKDRSTKTTSRVANKIPDNKFGSVRNDDIQEATIIDGRKIIRANLPVQGDGEDRNDFIRRYNKYVDEAMEKYPDMDLIHMKEGDSMHTVFEVPDKQEFAPQKGSAEQFNGVITDTTPKPEPDKGLEHIDGKYNLKELEDMDTKVLLKMVMDDMDMMEACEMIGGKNTNKKLREIIFAHQNNSLAEHVAKNLPKENAGEAPGSNDTGAVIQDQGVIQPNKDFDTQKSDTGFKKPNTAELFPGELSDRGDNKYGLKIPEFDKGDQRDFATMKQLFNLMASINPPVNNPRYLELGAKMGILEKYQDREQFCKLASVSEINSLLNQN